MLLPRSMKMNFLKFAHTGATGGHLGIRRTKLQVRRRMYWVGWSKDVERFCQQCPECCQYIGDKPQKKREETRAPVNLVYGTRTELETERNSELNYTRKLQERMVSAYSFVREFLKESAEKEDESASEQLGDIMPIAEDPDTERPRRNIRRPVRFC